jgi:hypothetical protein
LFGVDGEESFEGFEFDDYEVVDDHVGSETFVEFQFVVGYGDGYLALGVEAAFVEFVGENYVVDSFEEAGAGSLVDLHGGVDDSGGDGVFCHGATLAMRVVAGKFLESDLTLR